MNTTRPVFEIIPAEPESAIALGILYEEPRFPSGRIVLFFSLILSLMVHLMLLGRHL